MSHMDTELEFVPRKKLIELKEKAEEFLKNENKPELEKAEALEALGVGEFFDGNYKKSIQHLNHSLSLNIPISRRTLRRICMTKFILGLSYYREGDLSSSLEAFQNIVSQSKEEKMFSDLNALACSNISLIYSIQGNLREAIQSSREALEISTSINQLNSQEHLQHIRILVSLYIKANEYAKAETLVEDSMFCIEEKVLLLAGISYSKGEFDKAKSNLSVFEPEALQESISRLDISTKNFSNLSKLENIVLKALLMFDIDMLSNSNSNGKYYQALKTMQKFVNKLRKRRKKFDQDKIDPYLKVAYDEDPDFVHHDYYMYPVVLWTSILESFAENSILVTSFNLGIKIESGDVIVNNETYQNDFEKLQKLFFRSLIVIDACYIHSSHFSDENDLDDKFFDESVKLKVENFNNINNNELENIDPSMQVENNSNELIEQSHELTITNCTQHSPNDIIDMSIQKEAMKNISSLTSMLNSDSFVNTEVSYSAIKVLKSFGIELNPANAQITISSPSKNKRKTGKNSSKEKEEYEYNPTKHDRLSIHSELTPNLQYLGRDEVNAWIQWALANIGGISFGFLGISSISSKDIISFSTKGKIENLPPESFLLEVRSRLVELDNKLLLMNVDEDLSPLGILESRTLILIVLVKLSAQLILKKEVLSHLNNLERITKELFEHRGKCLETLVYSALLIKFRLEYDEWMLSTSLTKAEQIQLMIKQFLPRCKEYYRKSKEIQDLIFIKDSGKKLMNIYTCINRLSNESSVVGNNISVLHNASVPGTMEELLQTDSKIIESNEAEDTVWIRRFAKVRALFYFNEMKSITSTYLSQTR